MKKCYYNVYSMNPSLFGTGQTGQERGRFLGKAFIHFGHLHQLFIYEQNQWLIVGWFSGEPG